MDSIIIDIIFVFVAIIIYFFIGVKAAHWYEAKLEKIEDQLWKGWQQEFNYGKEFFWTGLCHVFWWFVIPYELFTDFKQWRYPQCDPSLRKKEAS